MVDFPLVSGAMQNLFQRSQELFFKNPSTGLLQEWRIGPGQLDQIGRLADNPIGGTDPVHSRVLFLPVLRWRIFQYGKGMHGCLGFFSKRRPC
jgi:hypothetical protein